MSEKPISRFPVPELNNLPVDIRETILAVQEKSGFVPNVFLALANQYNTDLQFQFGGAIGWEFFGAQSESSIAYAHDVGGQPTCDVYVSCPYTVSRLWTNTLHTQTDPDTLFNNTRCLRLWSDSDSLLIQ